MILLVDEDQDFLLRQKNILENEGYEVITADSQREAENIINKTKPDLAIFEVILENKDSGFILCYKIKKKYPKVPVLLCTDVTARTGIIFGINSEDDRKWIKADAYLEKGIDKDNFVKIVNNLINH